MLSVPTGEGSSTSEQLVSLSLPPEDQQPLKLNINRLSPASLSRFVGKVKFIGGPPEENLTVQVSSESGDSSWYNSWVETGRMRRSNVRLAADEGQFTLASIPPGTYRITFESSSIEPKTLEHVKIPGELPVIEIHVVGKPHLTGTVVNAATGNPIPHFAVRARKLRTLGQAPNYVQEARWVQVSNPNGKFDIELVGPGIYQVQASVDGYAWSWSPETTVEKGKVDTTLKLTGGGALSGVVVDPDGKPVEGARVIALSMAKSVAMGYAERFGDEAGAIVTDATGHFTLPHLAQGSETIKVVHASFAPAVVENLKVAEGGQSDAGTVKLQVGGTVEGVIYDSQGSPIPGVTLQFQDESGYGGGGDEEAGRLAVVTSDDKGFFRVEHLPDQILWVNTAERWNRQGVTRRACHPVNGKTTRLDFGGTVPVKGRLLKDGKPIAGRRVELSVDSQYFGAAIVNGNTDSDGRFAFFGPPIGRYILYSLSDERGGDWVRVRDFDFAGELLDLGDVNSDLGEVVITLNADSAEDLTPITQATISTDVKGKLYQDHVAQARVDPSTPNTWRAENVPAGHFQVSLYAKGDGERSGMNLYFPFDRPAKTASTAVNVKVPHSSATLNVKLINPTMAEGSSGQSASIRSDDDRVQIWVSTEKPEPASVSLKVPPGTYHAIDSSSMQAKIGLEPVVLKDGESNDLQIDLKPGSYSQSGVIAQIRLWDATGIPLLGSKPKLVGADGNAIEPTSDSQVIGIAYKVAPGHYRVVLDRPGKPQVTREIDVAASGSKPGARWKPIDLFVD
jgi:hypothetical protein